jgi:hypothetical protein
MVGIILDDGLSLQDSDYVNGIAQGRNGPSATVKAFAGGLQPGATLIPVAAMLINIGTVVTAGDSVKLPFALKGHFKFLFNSTANSVNIFGAIGNNRKTGAVDTINGVASTTAYALAGGKSAIIFCPVDGAWAALVSA